MLIRTHDLEVRDLEFHQDFRPESIDLGPEARQESALHTQGRAELIEEVHPGRVRVQDIRLVGSFSTSVELRCGRCLEPVRRQVSGEFDLLYRPLGAERRGHESEITSADAEIGFYSGEGVLLEDVLKEQLLLAMPIRAVCREECRGLCPRCGRNRNLEACQCAEPLEDPRWSALKDLRNKLEG